MKLSRREKKYCQEHFGEVLHTTLDPEGPGVVRIHLIPPVCKEEQESSVVIVNGQDIIPVGFSWTILLSEFIREVNRYNGKEITEEDFQSILKMTLKGIRKVFPLLPKKRVEHDLHLIMNTFKQIAYREPVSEEIGYMSIGEYAPCMRAPHRMDLMVSAMTKDGSWHCNQKCVHCYAAGQAQADETELSTKEWMRVIDRCRLAGIPQITFTGGEPTMREDLVELIEHGKWFVTRLNTNGILLTPELCRRLYAASLDSLQITFYSYDPHIHNQLVGALRYDDTVNGIRNALAAGLSVSINTPLCSLNRDYVSTLVFLHEMGIRYVTCSGLITTGNALLPDSEEMQLKQSEITAILKDAAEFCFSHGMEISFTSPGWISDEVFEELGIMTPGCGACLSNMAVTPAGNVVPCQSWLSGGSLGNILTDEWEVIWNGEECRKRREFSAKMLGVCPLRKEGEAR